MPFYSVTLAPGDVRYLTATDFLKVKVEEWIEFFRAVSQQAKIEGLWGGNQDGLDFIDTEELLEDIAWEETFRILYGFAVLHRDFNVPSSVYRCFHSTLLLRSFEFAECANSWVTEAWKDSFITQSFANSAEHLILTCGDKSNGPSESRLVIFAKTPFVIERLEALRKLEVETKTAENLAQLRKTTFTTFVYIMEDLRNELFKIGQSQTPEKRENTLQSEVPEVSLRFYIPAHASAEQELHDLFSEKRVRGEWFALTPEDVLSVVEFLKRNGDMNRLSVDYEWLGKISLLKL